MLATLARGNEDGQSLRVVELSGEAFREVNGNGWGRSNE
jgi:hypothetical protein